MCYSAMVKASLKSLGMDYGARIQEDAFEKLYEARKQGSGAKIPREFEPYFIESKTEIGHHISRLILDWNEGMKLTLQKSLEEQTERRERALSKLQGKKTKTAENELRIANKKIQSINEQLFRMSEGDVQESQRIFPGSHAALMVMEKGARVIRPFRYQLRPNGEPESFDQKFNGTYNIRRDRLKEVHWWKSLYGKHHGALLISKFYENVSRHRFFRESLGPGESEQNLVVEFSLKTGGEVWVPCLFDHNEEGVVPLDSFALITDDPNPEVLAAGHDRTPVFLRPSHLDAWLDTDRHSLQDFDQILRDRQETEWIARSELG